MSLSHMLITTTVIVISACCATAQKPTIDCSKIRGVCYNPKPEAIVRKELAYGARVELQGKDPRKSENLPTFSCYF